MLADIGGYLGLMLGYSAYSIVDFIDYAHEVYKNKEKVKQDLQMLKIVKK